MPPHTNNPIRIQLGFSALLILPLLVTYLLPWPLFHSDYLHASWLYGVYLPSAMISLPNLLFTIAFLLLITQYKLKLSIRSLIMLTLALGALLVTDWVIKSVIKQLTTEPRPYLLWLEEKGLIPSIGEFYSSAKSLRKEWVLAAGESLAIPNWLKLHWQAEVSYAFPSGHSIAAFSLAQFFGQIWLARAPKGAWLLILAALATASSRLIMGMHWPIDVITSAVIGCLTAFIAARWWLQRN